MISFPFNFQVLNPSSTIQLMDHYIAANSLFVSQILLELENVKYDDPEHICHSLIWHEIQFENLQTPYISILLISKSKKSQA